MTSELMIVETAVYPTFVETAKDAVPTSVLVERTSDMETTVDKETTVETNDKETTVETNDKETTVETNDKETTVETNDKETTVEINDKETTVETKEQKIERLKREIAELGGNVVEKKANDGVKKNHRPGKADASKKYKLLARVMPAWGKVPQQQADLAKLLSDNMEVGKEYTEAEVFNILIDGCGDYNSLCTSKQDVTYLFRYYRGLKNDAKHAGFIARNFVQVIG